MRVPGRRKMFLYSVRAVIVLWARLKHRVVFRRLRSCSSGPFHTALHDHVDGKADPNCSNADEFSRRAAVAVDTWRSKDIPRSAWNGLFCSVHSALPIVKHDQNRL